MQAKLHKESYFLRNEKTPTYSWYQRQHGRNWITWFCGQKFPWLHHCNSQEGRKFVRIDVLQVEFLSSLKIRVSHWCLEKLPESSFRGTWRFCESSRYWSRINPYGVKFSHPRVVTLTSKYQSQDMTNTNKLGFFGSSSVEIKVFMHVNRSDRSSFSDRAPLLPVYVNFLATSYTKPAKAFWFSKRAKCKQVKPLRSAIFTLNLSFRFQSEVVNT